MGWVGLQGQVPQLFLTNGTQELPAKIGIALPDGFTVSEISFRGVVLVHPPTQTTYALPLPDSLPAAGFEPQRRP